MTHGRSDAIAALKACSKSKDLCRGRQIHADLASDGMLPDDVHLGSILVNMYAKCGDVKKAQEVFDELPARDVVSWTSLIGGYASVHGLEEEALRGFELMQQEGFVPDPIAFVYALKACGNLGMLGEGQALQAEIARRGWLEHNAVIANVSVEMYAKCGAIRKARETFDALIDRGADAWNAIIGAYIHHGDGEEALRCLERMQHGGSRIPDAGTYVLALKGCEGPIGSEMGRRIHARIAGQRSVRAQVCVGNVLVDLYARCGSEGEAAKAFDELRVRDHVSWTALMAGYLQRGCAREALDCYDGLLREALAPDAVALSCVFKACGLATAMAKGCEMHARIAGEEAAGSAETHVLVGNAMLDMYAKCGAIRRAGEVFDGLARKDSVSWNSIIAGHAEAGDGSRALELFRRMRLEGLAPDPVTYICVLKACACVGVDEAKGLEIHARIAGDAEQAGDALVRNTLVDMYAARGALDKAQRALDDRIVRAHRADVVAWNALISGYVQHGHHEQALRCFELMRRCDQAPDAVTLVCVLKACASLGACEKGREIHAAMEKASSEKKDACVANALMDMYFKCGSIRRAQGVFDAMGGEARGVVAWNVLIAGYAQAGYNEEAVGLFFEAEAAPPNDVTWACVLRAIGSLGCADKGRAMHGSMTKTSDGQRMERDGLVGGALVDMYAKCGMLGLARHAFSRLSAAKTASVWNSLISGYAQYGDEQAAFAAFRDMSGAALRPDRSTFGGLLSACAHSGRPELGQLCIAAMIRARAVAPAIEHFLCIVELYGRAGDFERLAWVVDTMPFRTGLGFWHAVLGAASRKSDPCPAELARWAFASALELDANDAVPYVFMSNVYASAAGTHSSACTLSAL